jgi:hypothetical protein
MWQGGEKLYIKAVENHISFLEDGAFAETK